ncbi:unnamed protein product [Amaranthus hypochondriacus]
MDMFKKWKKNILTRCKSTKEKPQKTISKNPNTLPKCKSYPPPWCSPSPSTSSPSTKAKAKRPMTPGGCFSVYVGSERQRFVIKTKYVNHPLFKMLLDDAEQQYGYSSEGPILLPCDVDMFYKVLAEMDCDSTDHIIHSYGCGSYGSYSLLSPSKLLKMNQF